MEPPPDLCGNPAHAMLNRPRPNYPPIGVNWNPHDRNAHPGFFNSNRLTRKASPPPIPSPALCAG